MKKFIKIFLISLLLSSNSYAGSDGELELSKKNRPTKDCFEK
jgi:phospholipid-binding lipoprotein MlaA